MPKNSTTKSVNNHDLYELRLLEQVEQSPQLNNRKASAILGVSLKLAHDMLTQMVGKGLLSVTKLNSRRWDYHLTPAGLVRKGRLTYEFLDFSMHFFREARRDSALLCRRLAESGKRDVAIIGAGNLAEITYLGMSEWGLNLQAVYDDRDGVFMQVPIQPLAQVPNDRSDALIVCVYDAKHPMTARYLPPGLHPMPHMVWPVGAKAQNEYVVVVEAAMGQSTPAGLVLEAIGERPVLGWALDRLRSAGLPVMVSTSNHASDDPIAAYCETTGVACSRGDLLNRAQRLRDLARQQGVQTLIRVNGLCPLLDPAIVSEALKAYREQDGCRLLSSVDNAEWPVGLQLDIVDTDAFTSDYDAFSQPEDFDRIRNWYLRESADQLAEFPGPGQVAAPLLAATPEALQRLAALLPTIENWRAPWHEVAAQLERQR